MAKINIDLSKNIYILICCVVTLRYTPWRSQNVEWQDGYVIGNVIRTVCFKHIVSIVSFTVVKSGVNASVILLCYSLNNRSTLSIGFCI